MLKSLPIVLLGLLGIASVSCQKEAPIPEDIPVQVVSTTSLCADYRPSEDLKSGQQITLNQELSKKEGKKEKLKIDLDEDGKDDITLVFESKTSKSKNNEILKLEFEDKSWSAHYSVVVESTLFCDNPEKGYNRVSYRNGQQNLSCINLPYKEDKKNNYISRLNEIPTEESHTWTNNSTLLSTTVNEYYEDDYYYKLYHTGTWYAESGMIVLRKEIDGKFLYATLNLCTAGQSTQENTLIKYHLNKIKVTSKGLVS